MSTKEEIEACGNDATMDATYQQESGSASEAQSNEERYQGLGGGDSKAAEEGGSIQREGLDGGDGHDQLGGAAGAGSGTGREMNFIQSVVTDGDAQADKGILKAEKGREASPRVDAQFISIVPTRIWEIVRTQCLCSVQRIKHCLSGSV